MEQVLDEYRNKFGTLDYAPMGMFILRNDYTILFWNKCLETWTNHSSEEICGKDIRQCFAHFKTPAYYSRLDQLFLGGAPAVFSSQLHNQILPAKFHNGNDRILNTTVTAVPALGDEQYCALFSVEDVSSLSAKMYDYKKMKDKALAEVDRRKNVEQELIKKNSLLQNILTNSPIGIVLVNNDKIAWANDAVLKLFGLKTLDDYVGASVVEFYASIEEFEKVKTHTAKYINVSGDVPPLEIKCRKVDGTEFTAELMVTSQNSDNNFDNRIVTVFDLTERRKAENDRILAGKLRASLEMTGTICHEMNQPIMAISGYSELLLLKMDENNPYYEKIKNINYQSMRIGEITKKLMNFTNYETIEYTKGEKIVNIHR